MMNFVLLNIVFYNIHPQSVLDLYLVLENQNGMNISFDYT